MSMGSSGIATARCRFDSSAQERGRRREEDGRGRVRRKGSSNKRHQQYSCSQQESRGQQGPALASDSLVHRDHLQVRGCPGAAIQPESRGPSLGRGSQHRHSRCPRQPRCPDVTHHVEHNPRPEPVQLHRQLLHIGQASRHGALPFHRTDDQQEAATACAWSAWRLPPGLEIGRVDRHVHLAFDTPVASCRLASQPLRIASPTALTSPQRRRSAAKLVRSRKRSS